MKRTLLFVQVILLSIVLFGCTDAKTSFQEAGSGQTEQNDASTAGLTKSIGSESTASINSTIEGIDSEDANASKDEKAVADLVDEFGKKLKMISLLAPKDTLDKSMQENYNGLVSPELIAKWQGDPQNAPGRMVSSPWPDRIEVGSMDKVSDNSYEVKGEIIEITSVEESNGGAAARRPITLEVKRNGGNWLIDSVVLGDYMEDESIVYDNSKYGFTFTLPISWKGYTIITDNWQGLSLNNQEGEKTVATGPIISIRHPDWTSQNQRQDIPIMVFTQEQWTSLQQDEFHIGAAPIGPSELGRNSAYVFALPARYNYAFPVGFEEVENILSGNPLKPR